MMSFALFRAKQIMAVTFIVWFAAFDERFRVEMVEAISRHWPVDSTLQSFGDYRFEREDSTLASPRLPMYVDDTLIANLMMYR